jgi:serine/threonine protein phosphatase 1
MRKFFISDIHGHYKEMIALLKHAEFNPSIDTLVFGGDMINRGKDSGLVLLKVKKLCDKYPKNIKAIIGNHEEMMKWYLIRRTNMWLNYGGIEAINSFNKVFGKEQEIWKPHDCQLPYPIVIENEVFKEHVEWAINLPMIIEEDEFIFGHAGFNPQQDLFNQSREVLWMINAEWQAHSNKDILNRTKGKKIVHGHYADTYVIDDGARIACDLGAGVLDENEHALALVDLTKNIYYAFYIKKKEIKIYDILKRN